MTEGNRVARVATALLTLALTFFVGVRLAPKFSNGPQTYLPRRIANNTGHGRETGKVIANLRANGVLIRQPVRDSIDAMVWWWDRREDLQRNFSLPDGSPEIVGLIRFSQSSTDATAASLVPYQAGIEELRGRLGLVDIAQPDITRELFWLFANRAHPKIDTDGTIGVLAQWWRQFPDQRAQFVKNGRLQLGELLFWGFSLPSSNPAYVLFGSIAYQLEQLPAEFK